MQLAAPSAPSQTAMPQRLLQTSSPFMADMYSSPNSGPQPDAKLAQHMCFEPTLGMQLEGSRCDPLPVPPPLPPSLFNMNGTYAPMDIPLSQSISRGVALAGGHAAAGTG